MELQCDSKLFPATKTAAVNATAFFDGDLGRRYARFFGCISKKLIITRLEKFF